MAKRIIRLTESDLMRIVKKVVKEQKTPDPSAFKSTGVSRAAADMFIDAIGTFTDDEAKAAKAVLMLKTAKDYYEFCVHIKALSGKQFYDLFNDNMSPYDQEYFTIQSHVQRITEPTGMPVDVGQITAFKTFMSSFGRLKRV